MKKISCFILMVLIIPAMVSCTLPFSPVFPEDEQQGNALNPSGSYQQPLLRSSRFLPPTPPPLPQPFCLP